MRSSEALLFTYLVMESDQVELGSLLNEAAQRLIHSTPLHVRARAGPALPCPALCVGQLRAFPINNQSIPQRGSRAVALARRRPPLFGSSVVGVSEPLTDDARAFYSIKHPTPPTICIRSRIVVPAAPSIHTSEAVLPRQGLQTTSIILRPLLSSLAFRLSRRRRERRAVAAVATGWVDHDQLASLCTLQEIH